MDSLQGNILGSVAGALMGALFAGLIAIYTVRRTFHNARRIEEENNKRQDLEKINNYCGLLFMVYSELYGHDVDTSRLRPAVTAYTKAFEKLKDVISENPFRSYHTEFIELCRTKILDYDFFGSETIISISHYLNSIRDLNFYLRLERLRGNKTLFGDDEAAFSAGIQAYFREVAALMDKMGIWRAHLKDQILSEIGKFPQSDIDIDSLLKELEDPEELLRLL